MPYISLEERIELDKALNLVPTLETKGQLEYCIFKLMQHYMSTRSARYATLHDCVYAAIHCGDEFRRRFLDTREDEAIAHNGDIP